MNSGFERREMFWLILILAFVLVLFYFWDKSIDSPSPKAKSKNARRSRKSDSNNIPIDLPECRAAVHEAGHAITAWSCTIVIDIESAAIKGGEGHVRYKHSV